MNLESLVNELFLDLFEFLPTAQLFRAFNGLNSRFDTLLSIFLQASRRIDCRSMSKKQFNIVSEQYLPKIVNRVISLCLSDDDETPGQIDYFFSHNLNLYQFTNLRSLFFYQLHSKGTMNNIMIAWVNLLHLTHLNFIDCYFRYEEKDVLRLVNSIWNLPKLTHCHLDITFQFEPYFIAPTVCSKSLEYLFIRGSYCRLKDLTGLFQNTIQLRHLCANINAHLNGIPLQSTLTSMISLTLKFSVEDSINVMIDLLKNMPNLRRLTVETLDIYVDGNKWKQMIVNYSPKLQVFRLKMQFYFRNRQHIKQNVDQLLDSFRTSFWMEEHRWFIQCHWDPHSNSNYAFLYTLPYSFPNGPRIDVSQSQSTYSDGENTNWSYDHVRILNYRTSPIGDLALCQSRFVNIEHLTLSLPITDQFWTIVPRLDRLTSLEVSLHNRSNNALSQLQAIFDRAPRLTSLKFGSWLTSEVPLIKMMSASVRQIDLRGNHRWYNDFNCMKLILSSLAFQCEVLRIDVENRTNILDLATKMPNLRALNVRCEDDTWKSSMINDELLEWLQSNLQSTCTITRHPRYTLDILLWLR